MARLLAMPNSDRLASWMLFADGENLTIRGQEVAARHGLQMCEGDFYKHNVFLWIPQLGGRENFLRFIKVKPLIRLQEIGLRSFYYTSMTGDTDAIVTVQESLWDLGFSPRVFKKHRRNQKSKGVDIALATDMLSNAYMGNYDVAVLIAGDGDFVPLVEEVKRLGKLVYVVGFRDSGLNGDLRLTADAFFNLEQIFTERWRGWIIGQQPR